jgi:hypothetical protein
VSIEVVIVVAVLKGGWVAFRLHVQERRGTAATYTSIDTTDLFQISGYDNLCDIH